MEPVDLFELVEGEKHDADCQRRRTLRGWRLSRGGGVMEGTLREAAELLTDVGTDEYVNPPTAEAMQRCAAELRALPAMVPRDDAAIERAAHWMLNEMHEGMSNRECVEAILRAAGGVEEPVVRLARDECGYPVLPGEWPPKANTPRLCTRCAQPVGLSHVCGCSPLGTTAGDWASAWAPDTPVVVESPGSWAHGKAGVVARLRPGNAGMCLVQLDGMSQFYARDDELRAVTP